MTDPNCQSCLQRVELESAQTALQQMTFKVGQADRARQQAADYRSAIDQALALVDEGKMFEAIGVLMDVAE